jgi:hypothetical protein
MCVCVRSDSASRQKRGAYSTQRSIHYEKGKAAPHTKERRRAILCLPSYLLLFWRGLRLDIMASSLDPDVPSVITSDVYNDAEVSFAMLQNKEKLVSFLDCTTLLRSMGMNPTHDDMDKLKELMAGPIARLEEWRREEELRQDKEGRKEDARERKGKNRGSVAPAKKSLGEKAGDDNGATTTDAAAAASAVTAAASLTPAEEIKNIDWNIFIHCTERIFRDRMREEHAVAEALKVFANNNGNSGASSSAATMTRDRLMEIVTTHGDNVLTPAEVKVLVTMLPESCSVKELAARIQGTYVAPTQEELDAAAARELEMQRQQEAAEKTTGEDDPLKGL